MSGENGKNVPLWLWHDDECEPWRQTQSPLTQRWLETQSFRADRHATVLVPDAQGGPAAAIGGLGKRSETLSLWHAAGIAARLPPGGYRLAQAWSATQATQIALGVAYAAYRFDRYRAAKNEGQRSSLPSRPTCVMCSAQPTACR